MENVNKGECIPCNTLRYLLCQQIILTTTSESTQTKEKFNIYHKISCESNYVIHLLEYLLCKIQYVRNLETLFHINLSNHRKDIKILSLSKHAKIKTGTTSSINMENSY